MRHLCCALLSFATVTTTLAAEVYRSVDENGVVVYSDRPEPDSERIYVATTRPATTSRSLPRATEEPAEPDAAPRVDGGEIPREPSAEERAMERERNCTVARERAERYRVSRRLYRNLPDGEREYLSDDEIDQARSRADADVARWCD